MQNSSNFDLAEIWFSELFLVLHPPPVGQYCFRQNFNYIGHDAVSNYLAIEDYIYRHPKINSKTRLGYLCISPATGEFSSSFNGSIEKSSVSI
jgi:hypothetical protein